MTTPKSSSSLSQLLNKITPLPWRYAEMDNDKVMPTVRLFGRRTGDPAKEICFGRIDSRRDASYSTHAANVLPELVTALKQMGQAIAPFIAGAIGSRNPVVLAAISSANAALKNAETII